MKTKAVRKKPNAKSRTGPPDDWQATYQSMVRDYDLLQAEVQHLRAENKMLRYNLYVLMDKEYGKPIDTEKLLAEALPSSIKQIIAELKQRENGHAARS